MEWLQSAFQIARENREPAAMVVAAKEIGKMLGLYAPETRRVELTAGQDAMQVRFERMSDAQLLALMGAGAG